MRAVWYEKTGPAADVLVTGDVSDPRPAAGEVLVRVAASGINPIDVKWRKGLRVLEEGEKVIPHFDGAGVIEDIGDGVPKERLGERVWLFEAAWQRPSGTAAEFTALPSGLAVTLPDTVDFAVGACLGIPAMTAHRCVFADGPVTGQTVLVTGGGGAVGGFAVRFAKLGGATVIATVSTDDKAALATKLGADHVVNYKTEDATQRIKEIGGDGGIDRVVEVALGVNFPVTAEVISNNGVVAAYASDDEPEPTLPFRPFLYKNITVRHVLVFGIPPKAKADAIADITRWLAAGELNDAVGQRFAMEDIAKAHEAVEEGALGNVVIEIGG
jgi:NADPH2:quinone reductase